MAEPTIGSMLAAMGSPVDYQAINTAKLFWDDATGLFYASGGLKTNRMGLFGTYDSSQVQGIWSLGEDYPISTQNNTFGTQYGLGYGYETYGGGLTGWGHQIHFLGGGTRMATVSITTGNLWLAGPSLYLGGQTNYAWYYNSGNSGYRTSANLLTDGNIWWGTGGNWLSTYLNQAVRTDSIVSFQEIHITTSYYGIYQSNPTMRLGASGFYRLELDYLYNFYPLGGDKVGNCGYPGGYRWAGVYCSSLSQGTSRLTKAKTNCPLCGKKYSRGTGTTITLGEDADYIQTFCLDCKIMGIEEVQHLPKNKLSRRREAPKIEFKGMRIQKMGGNSRQVFVDFEYGPEIDIPVGNHIKTKKQVNSTIMGEQELEDFLTMTEGERVKWLHDVGLREWHSMEENDLIEEDMLDLHTTLHNHIGHLKNKCMKEEVKKHG